MRAAEEKLIINELGPYIEMHRGPAAYVLGPPPSRGRDLELEGGVNACYVEYVYERVPRLPRARYRVMAS